MKRNGTVFLFAALVVLIGELTAETIASNNAENPITLLQNQAPLSCNKSNCQVRPKRLSLLFYYFNFTTFCLFYF